MTPSPAQVHAELIAWAVVVRSKEALARAQRGYPVNGGTVVMFGQVRQAEADHDRAVDEYQTVCNLFMGRQP